MSERRSFTGLARTAGLAAGMLLVAGCSTGGRCIGDPRVDDLFCSVGNHADGTYRRQTDELRRESEDKRAALAALERRNAELERRSAALRGEERALSAQARRSRERVAELRRRLVTLQAQGRVSSAEAAPAMLEIDRLNREAAVAETEREIRVLEEDIDTLLRLVEQIGAS